MLLGPNRVTIELQLAASAGSYTIKPELLTNPCLLLDNLESAITRALENQSGCPATKATGKHQLALKQLSAPWQTCKSCVFLILLFLFLDFPHKRLTEKQGVSHCLFQQFFLNVADTKPRADLFPTQSCTAFMYNLQDDQAHISSHALFSSTAAQKSSPERKKQTNETHNDQKLWLCQ